LVTLERQPSAGHPPAAELATQTPVAQPTPAGGAGEMPGPPAPRRWARACRTRLVSLPGGQRLALWRMEKALLAEDLRLDSAYAIFARTTRHDAMPLTERLPPRPWRQQAALIAATGLAVAAIQLLRSDSEEPDAPRGQPDEE
jgi:hypothetical protein